MQPVRTGLGDKCRHCERGCGCPRVVGKPEAGDHRPTAGKSLARFSQSRLRAARGRRPSTSSRNGISPHPTNGSVMSRVRIRTAIESARPQNHSGELPCWLLADSNFKNGQGDGICTRTVRVTGGDANCYITTLKNGSPSRSSECEGWSPWSDLHRRIRVYETRPVASEAQGLKVVSTAGIAPATSAFAGRRSDLSELRGQIGIRGRTRTG